ncbi:MAG: DUF2878 family protein [Thiolinea sp.]
MVALLLGAVGGPLAFMAGQRLGAVMFPDEVVAMTVLAGGWALWFVWLMILARRHDGFPYLDEDTRRIST